MRWMKTTSWLPCLVLLGCTMFTSVDEDNWVEKGSNASCDFMRRCYAAEFFYSYDDMEDCVDEYEDYYDDLEDFYDDCDFDEDQAEECITMLKGSCRETGEDLDDLAEECAAVWDCDG